MSYPVVGAGITVVQNFQASLYQRSCLIFCDFYLVVHHLPHQGLQNHKHVWWVHTIRFLIIKIIWWTKKKTLPEPNKHQILLLLLGLHMQLLTCPHNQESLRERHKKKTVQWDLNNSRQLQVIESQPDLNFYITF